MAHVVAPPLCMAHDQGGAEVREDGAPSLTCNHEAPIVFSDGLNGQDAYTGRVLAVALRGREGGGTAELGGEQAGTLRASTGGGDKPYVMVQLGVDCYNGAETGDVAATMGTGGSPINSAGPQVMTGMAVRRLTPVECERLQGFPDEYTRIPWKRKPADECPDGPRYKALGNSMAVPCMMWIGKQVQKALV